MRLERICEKNIEEPRTKEYVLSFMLVMILLSAGLYSMGKKPENTSTITGEDSRGEFIEEKA